MAEINKLTGRNYQLFNYYGDPNADRVIIAMGSLCDTAMEVVDYLNAKGEKVGVVSIHLYRPFSVKHFLNALPKTVKKIVITVNIIMALGNSRCGLRIRVTNGATSSAPLMA